jgi:IPT/TIG domain
MHRSVSLRCGVCRRQMERGNALDRNRKWAVSRIVLVLALALSLGVSMLSGGAALASTSTAESTVDTGPLLPPPEPVKPMGQAKNVPDRTKLAHTSTPALGPQTEAATDPTIDMKLLVISADGKEADLPAIQQSLDYFGTPYTLYIATKTPNGLTADKLTDPANAKHAFYQGVILTTGDLVYDQSGTGAGPWLSGLSTAEWTNLTNYEVTFGIRRISWYTTWPSPDYGFVLGGTGVDTSATPLAASFTSVGKTIFGYYVNTANPLMIQNAWTLQAKALDATTQPVLTDPSGNLLAAIYTHKDANNYPAFDTLALTFDSAPWLTHSLVLAHGLVNWVTKGFFLGERHAILTTQPDDVFNDNDMWSASFACGKSLDDTGITYRIGGNDLLALAKWQQTKDASQITKDFEIEMPFNGVGTTTTFINEEGTPAGQFKPDTLTPAARLLQGQFNWISHTWDHTNLDAMSYADAVKELTQNNTLATQLGLRNYTKATLVTPDVSGLTNANFLKAAYDNAVRYLVSDTSKAGYNNPTPNAGIYNPLQPSILMIPRHPTNLYFNVQKPADWLAEDNCLYPAGAWGHVDTYQQLLDRESNMLLTYLLKGDIDPLMFHQPNLGAYDGTHSLLGDLMDATFAKYSKLVSVPISSPTQEELGQRMAARMTYNASGVTAQMIGQGKFVITTKQAATIPVTGLLTSCSQCTTEPYAGQNITWVKLNAGQSVTLTAQNPLPTPPSRLAVLGLLPNTGTVNGKTNVLIAGIGFDSDTTVTFDNTPATVTNVSQYLMTVSTPAHAAGAVTVTVKNGDQTVTLTNGFTYKSNSLWDGSDDPASTPAPNPAPTPRSTPPAAGSTSGGAPVGTPAPIPTGR